MYYALHITVDHTVRICSQQTVYPLESGISARIITPRTSPYYVPTKQRNEMKWNEKEKKKSYERECECFPTQ